MLFQEITESTHLLKAFRTQHKQDMRATSIELNSEFVWKQRGSRTKNFIRAYLHSDTVPVDLKAGRFEDTFPRLLNEYDWSRNHDLITYEAMAEAGYLRDYDLMFEDVHCNTGMPFEIVGSYHWRAEPPRIQGNQGNALFRSRDFLKKLFRAEYCVASQPPNGLCYDD